MMKTVALAVAICMMFVCPVLAQELVVDSDVTYGKAGDEELKLNIARPAGDGPFPAVVFIHGGGWYLGNRQGYRSETTEAIKRGYAAVTISYRLITFD